VAQRHLGAGMTRARSVDGSSFSLAQRLTVDYCGKNSMQTGTVVHSGMLTASARFLFVYQFGRRTGETVEQLVGAAAECSSTPPGTVRIRATV
jgi:hypothetical protein